MSASRGAFFSLASIVPCLRMLTVICAFSLVFPLFFSLNAYAMGPDDRGGPAGGGPGGGGQGSGGPPGGPPGPSGPPAAPSAARDFSGPSRDFGERHGERGREGGFGRTGRGGQSFRSTWNEEGFFDDTVPNQDHQKALAGVRSGRFRSLKEIIAIVGIPSSSRIVGVDLLNQAGTDVYSIIVRDVSGHLERMTVDAATGERIN
jgi:hypothetical protein